MTENDKVEEQVQNEAADAKNAEAESQENEQNTADVEEQKNEDACEEGADREPSLEEKLTVANDKYLRLNAEFDNYRKRTAKERVELINTASKDVLKDLLDVLDDAERTEALLKNDEVEMKALKEGVQLVFNKLRKTLEQKGLQAFDSQGETFDVELHEALTEIPAPNKKLKGKVVDEIQKGYNLNGKLIRHAKVVVGK